MQLSSVVFTSNQHLECGSGGGGGSPINPQKSYFEAMHIGATFFGYMSPLPNL